LSEKKKPSGRRGPAGIAAADFTDEEILRAAESGGLLTLELEMSYACNLRCTYCYAEAGRGDSPVMKAAVISDVLAQARDLGARRIIILGGGEPLLYSGFRPLVDEIVGMEMSVELFTNATLVDAEMARFLHDRGVAVVAKRNSADKAVQDRLAGVEGAYELIEKGIAALFEAGYPGDGRVLGVQTVICRDNLHEIPSLWRWARERNVEPYFETLTMQGRATEGGLAVSAGRARKVFETLAEIDREEFGIEWTPKPPIAARSCKRHLHSILVRADGGVAPCVGVDIAVGNVHRDRLADVIAASPVIRDLRHIRTRIKGACASCSLGSECYGCRGNAYQMTGDYLAADPFCWLCGDNPDSEDRAGEAAEDSARIG
jgi:radical SAM protein with 4Fe4S-binding SPASM domain